MTVFPSRPFWLLVLLVYTGLLMGSHVWRAARDQPSPSSPYGKVIELREGDLYWREIGNGKKDQVPVLLLHGSPMASGSFDPMIREFAGKRDWLVPDLPGFADSRGDYRPLSFEKQAERLLEWMDRIGVERAHVVGYSLGGAVALQMWEQQGERVASIVLLSSIGVQELELTGDALLNHGIHGIQYFILWCLQELTPQYGVLDDFLINTVYARSFYESDQRPLRDILTRYDRPMLILHGKEDFLVNPQAASEHDRIVPQAKLVWFEGGHEIPFTQPASLNRELDSFFDDIEAGEAPTRRDVSSAEASRAVLPYEAVGTMRLMGSAFWIMVIVIANSTLISEDLACLAAGLLAARGLLGIPEAVAACFVGIFIGDVLLDAIGRIGGLTVLNHPQVKKWVPEHRRETARLWLEENTARAICFSRFIPGARLPTYLLTGVLHISWPKVALNFAIWGALWSMVIVSLTAFLGKRFSAILMDNKAWAFPGLILFLIAAWFLSHCIPALFSWRGRRLLLGKWRRYSRWEFWSPYVFYPPVVIWSLVLALRYRGWTVFTAANRGMEHGGFIGESKRTILEGLKPSGSVAPFLVLPGPEHSLADVQSWMEEVSLEYPIVGKPDIGERGNGVQILRDEEALRNYLEDHQEPLIVQAFVPGREFGVFYIRDPREDNGFIFSITQKTLTSVTGDGESNLEQLILADERAVCMAPYFLEKHGHQLSTIPKKGEVVRLTNLGTHCKGALFEDGRPLITEALTSEINRIAKAWPGFAFGRFDIRCPSEEDFRQGRSLTVLELNGVTSEATHIYQPGYPLRRAYADLFAQWEWAYRIGRIHSDQGPPHTPTLKLAGVLLKQM